MKQTLAAVEAAKLSVADDSESLLYFLKRHQLLEEVVPLHSAAKQNRKSKILKEALSHWLVRYCISDS